MPTQPTPRFLPMRHVSNRTIRRDSEVLAGGGMDHCTAQRRQPVDSRFPTIAWPLASLRFDVLTLASPLAHAACGSLSASRLRIEFTTPGACSGCEPGVWGVRRARFGLSIPNSSTLQGGIEGGQGVGQWGVARDWQALWLLDKPTRAGPTSFLSVSDPQPK